MATDLQWTPPISSAFSPPGGSVSNVRGGTRVCSTIGTGFPMWLARYPSSSSYLHTGHVHYRGGGGGRGAGGEGSKTLKYASSRVQLHLKAFFLWRPARNERNFINSVSGERERRSVKRAGERNARLVSAVASAPPLFLCLTYLNRDRCVYIYIYVCDVFFETERVSRAMMELA